MEINDWDEGYAYCMGTGGLTGLPENSSNLFTMGYLAAMRELNEFNR